MSHQKNDVEKHINDLVKTTGKSKDELIALAKQLADAWYSPAMLQYALYFLEEKVATLGDGERETVEKLIVMVKDTLKSAKVEPIALDVKNHAGYKLVVWMDIVRANVTLDINITREMIDQFEQALKSLIDSFPGYWSSVKDTPLGDLFARIDSIFPDDRVTSFEHVNFGYIGKVWKSYKLCIQAAYFDDQNRLLVYKKDK